MIEFIVLFLISMCSYLTRCYASFFISLSWSIVFGAVALIYGNGVVSSETFIYIFTAISIFLAGDFLSRIIKIWLDKNEIFGTDNILIGNSILYNIALFVPIFLTGTLLYDIYFYDVNLSVSYAKNSYVNFVDTNEVRSIYFSAFSLSSYIYCVAFICALAGKSQRRFSLYIHVTIFLTLCALSYLVSGTRLVAISSLLFFMVFFVGFTFLISLRIKFIKIAFPVIFFLSFGLLFIFWTQVARYQDGFKSSLSIIEQVGPWLYGYLLGFDIWYSSFFASDLGYGANIFRGILRPLGIISYDRHDSVYFDSYSATNALSLFSILIRDFGIGGSIIFMFSFGFFYGLGFNYNYKNKVSGLFIKSVLAVSLIYSINSWYFGYGSRLVGIFVCLLLLFLLFRRALNQRSNCKSCTPQI